MVMSLWPRFLGPPCIWWMWYAGILVVSACGVALGLVTGTCLLTTLLLIIRRSASTHLYIVVFYRRLYNTYNFIRHIGSHKNILTNTQMKKERNQSFTAFSTHLQRHRPIFNRYLYEQSTKSVSRRKIFLYKILPSFVSNVLIRLTIK